MKTIYKVLLVLCAVIGIVCMVVFSSQHDNSEVNDNQIITVSIPPIKYLVDRITGNDYQVNVILPPGSSPETYEPTPRQLKDIESSGVVFTVGLIDFENTIALRVARRNNKNVVLCTGIDLMEDQCNSHSGHGHSHSHGFDPHIWTSVSCLKIMANNILKGLPAEFMKEEYQENYNELIRELDSLDRDIRHILTENNTKSFVIYHPALTYYAQDYGLEQLQLELEGKEPTVERLAGVIERAKADGLDKILYQKEFSVKVVETAAKDIGATPAVIDPLSEDILTNLKEITRIIAE